MTRVGTPRLAIIAAVLLALAASACSSSGGSGPGSSTTIPSAAKSRTEIKSAFHILFDLANPAVDPKIAVVQNGASIKAAMTSEIKSALAKRAGGATVSSIAMEHGSACRAESLSSPCALVTYSIVSPSGAPLLANSKGFAVYRAPKWLVSKATICTLLTLANGNKAPAGC